MTVSGLCWRHYIPCGIYGAFSFVYCTLFTSQDRKVEQVLQVVIPVQLCSGFLYVPSIARFPLCLKDPLSKGMLALPTWSLRSWFACQGREFAKLFSKLQASLSDFFVINPLYTGRLENHFSCKCKTYIPALVLAPLQL